MILAVWTGIGPVATLLGVAAIGLPLTCWWGERR